MVNVSWRRSYSTLRWSPFSGGLFSLGYSMSAEPAMALADLADLDLERVSHRPLLGRIWDLCRSVTPYDALTLAETIEATLMTAERHLAQAPGRRCQIEYLS